MLVRRFMSPDVFTLAPTATCEAAYQELTKRRFRRAPVVENGALLGIVSLTDLTRRLVFVPNLIDTQEGRSASATLVRSIMSTQLKTAAPHEHIELASARMMQNRIGALPVVEHDHLVGMLTESDVFRALWSMLSWPNSRRIALEIDAKVAQKEPEFTLLARKHGCTLRSLIQSPRGDGGRLIDLLVEGGKVDALVATLWSLPATILSTDSPVKPVGQEPSAVTAPRA